MKLICAERNGDYSVIFFGLRVLVTRSFNEEKPCNQVA